MSSEDFCKWFPLMFELDLAQEAKATNANTSSKKLIFFIIEFCLVYAKVVITR